MFSNTSQKGNCNGAYCKILHKTSMQWDDWIGFITGESSDQTLGCGAVQLPVLLTMSIQYIGDGGLA